MAENEGYGDVLNSASMPYLNQLVPTGGLATNYYANAHDSLLDYFEISVGKTIATDDSYDGTVTDDNVVRALTAAGKTWKCYAQSLPSAGYIDGDSYPYVKRHDPFAYLSDVKNDAAQAANIVPLSQLATDTANGTLPEYAFIVPDQVHNAHDCPTANSSCSNEDKLVALDSWLSANVSPLLASSTFQSGGNGVMIITFDEAMTTDTTNGGGHVFTLFLGPVVKAGYQSTTLYQHQSTLRFALQQLGAQDFPGDAATAPDMTEFLQLSSSASAHGSLRSF